MMGLTTTDDDPASVAVYTSSTGPATVAANTSSTGPVIVAVNASSTGPARANKMPLVVPEIPESLGDAAVDATHVQQEEERADPLSSELEPLLKLVERKHSLSSLSKSLSNLVERIRGWLRNAMLPPTERLIVSLNDRMSKAYYIMEVSRNLITKESGEEETVVEMKIAGTTKFVQLLQKN